MGTLISPVGNFAAAQQARTRKNDKLTVDNRHPVHIVKIDLIQHNLQSTGLGDEIVK